MVSEISIDAALNNPQPIVDVRSPGEFEKGHIPGAVNVPLFSDEERARVGTVYKQDSKEAAMELGLKFVTPKLKDYIVRTREVAPQGAVTVHCQRGGMRSRAIADHLSTNGFGTISVVTGGYKAYRSYVLDSFARPKQLKILGGYTGSGKTPILAELRDLGEQVIDLEGLARHKGSAFGGIDRGAQPTVEQFENDLQAVWSSIEANRPVWMEDEGYNIGRVKIPTALFEQMRSAELCFVDIPKKDRAAHLVIEYAVCDDRLLAEAIQRISKRLGGLRTKEALAHLENNDHFEVAMITLDYYDKYYLRGLEKRDQNRVTRISAQGTDHKKNAMKILKITHENERN